MGYSLILTSGTEQYLITCRNKNINFYWQLPWQSAVFKKVQEKKKEQEAAKPDPDADYVDDDEDYGYDPEFEDDDADSSVAVDDNEPV